MAHKNRQLKPEQAHLAANLPLEGELGPAMLKLNERQRLFVLACLNLGSRGNHVRAAKQAGYTGSPEYLRVQAWRLAHDEKVQAAMLESAAKRIHSGAIPAGNLLVKAVGDPNVPMRDRVRASMAILDRSGMGAEQRISVTHNDSREEKLLRIISLAKTLGMDARALIGDLSDSMPGDFKVLEEAKAADNATQSDDAPR